MLKKLAISYEEIISVENLLEGWKEFLKGKRGKRDVQEFDLYLMDNVFDLHRELQSLHYKHGEYKALLGAQLVKIDEFLRKSLKIELHPNKVSISTLASGVDFLGWVHFPHHRVLRTTTKKRMLRKVREDASEATLASYRGMLSHGEAHGIYKHLA